MRLGSRVINMYEVVFSIHNVHTERLNSIDALDDIGQSQGILRFTNSASYEFEKEEEYKINFSKGFKVMKEN